MCKTFIAVYLICHMDYLTLHKESFGVIWIMFSFTNFEMVNTISISKIFWVCFRAFTLALFSHPPFFFLGIGSSCSMMLASLRLLSNLTELPHLVLSLEQASLYLCGPCAAYFLEYHLGTLHSSEEFPGSWNEHVFSSPVTFLLV